MIDRKLPIYNVIPRIQEALRVHGKVVLEAPTGAGKTTALPLALLDEPWLKKGKILLLEPRRMAARGAARRMSSVLGEETGETVGYRVKNDQKTSRSTKIEVITEGILIRMIQTDPSLEGISAVLFDEFHERNLLSDLGLALVLECRELFRDDLRLAIMSATLDGRAVAALLDKAPLITSEGRSFPVEIIHEKRAAPGEVEKQTVKMIKKALNDQEGNILVFLPGQKEINRAFQLLGTPSGVEVLPLHGRLSAKEQDRVMKPTPQELRRVILSTAIAETSLTIPGISTVVDAGLDRVPVYRAGRGLARLETVAVSKASAKQRAGRAGRLAPGTAYRLWSEAEHLGLQETRDPEITQTDLMPLVLELARWGADSPEELKWLNPPPTGAYAEGSTLLKEIDALTSGGKITPHGEKMSELPIHPRLAHMIIQSHDKTCLPSVIAALIEEGEILPMMDAKKAGVDLNIRLKRILSPYSKEKKIQQVQNQAKKIYKIHMHRELKDLSLSNHQLSHAGELLAMAYPERIGRRFDFEKGLYLLSGGQQVKLLREDPLIHQEWLIVGSYGGTGSIQRIFSALPLDDESILEHFKTSISYEDRAYYDFKSKKVRATRITKLGIITLSNQNLTKPPPEIRKSAYIAALCKEGLKNLPWTKKSSTLIGKMRILGKLLKEHPSSSLEWPVLDDETLTNNLDSWLTPWLSSEGPVTDLYNAILSLLSYDQQKLLIQWTPDSFKVPSGSQIKINYSEYPPVLAVRIQEVFSLKSHPSICSGQLPLSVHLLSPAQRPIQVTGDLPAFWTGVYGEVRKEMRGRYPKHYWPENPIDASPTTKTGRNRPEI